MVRRLVALNALLVLASAALVTYIGWELTRPAPESQAARPRAVQPAPPPAASPPDRPAPPGTYTSIASRNLFSPSRTEAPPTTATGPGGQQAVAQALPKPHLYGVVVREDAPIAYLEDPVTKRVAGYRVGDTIAGGTVQRIAVDRVVLVRPEGPVDVRLHDPSKPRPPAPEQPAQPGAAGRSPIRPGQTPGALGSGQRPSSAFAPGQGPNVPGRRLPPGLLRRLPRAQQQPPDAAND